jgi:hypothetical protein
MNKMNALIHRPIKMVYKAVNQILLKLLFLNKDFDYDLQNGRLFTCNLVSIQQNIFGHVKGLEPYPCLKRQCN